MTADNMRLVLLSKGSMVGKYRLGKPLGRGGFGVVFEAYDTEDAVQVAIKLIEVDLRTASSKSALDRFRMEVDAIRRIRHPNVVQVYESAVFPTEQHYVLAYYTMEVLDGRTLEQLIKAEGARPPHAALKIIRQAAAGLHRAHSEGIVHRDVKPGNIFLTSQGRAVVMDFGVCKLSDGTNVTLVGQVVGTPRYLAPEQMLEEAVDARTDVFALGALLYYLLTGEHLRSGKDVRSVFSAVTSNGDVRRVRQDKRVLEVVKDVLCTALAVKPAERFESARAMAEALEATELLLPSTEEDPADDGPGVPDDEGVSVVNISDVTSQDLSMHTGTGPKADGSPFNADEFEGEPTHQVMALKPSEVPPPKPAPDGAPGRAARFSGPLTGVGPTAQPPPPATVPSLGPPVQEPTQDKTPQPKPPARTSSDRVAAVPPPRASSDRMPLLPASTPPPPAPSPPPSPATPPPQEAGTTPKPAARNVSLRMGATGAAPVMLFCPQCGARLGQDVTLDMHLETCPGADAPVVQEISLPQLVPPPAASAPPRVASSTALPTARAPSTFQGGMLGEEAFVCSQCGADFSSAEEREAHKAHCSGMSWQRKTFGPLDGLGSSSPSLSPVVVPASATVLLSAPGPQAAPPQAAVDRQFGIPLDDGPLELDLSGTSSKSRLWMGRDVRGDGRLSSQVGKLYTSANHLKDKTLGRQMGSALDLMAPLSALLHDYVGGDAALTDVVDRVLAVANHVCGLAINHDALKSQPRRQPVARLEARLKELTSGKVLEDRELVRVVKQSLEQARAMEKQMEDTLAQFASALTVLKQMQEPLTNISRQANTRPGREVQAATLVVLKQLEAALAQR